MIFVKFDNICQKVKSFILQANVSRESQIASKSRHLVLFFLINLGHIYQADS